MVLHLFSQIFNISKLLCNPFFSLNSTWIDYCLIYLQYSAFSHFTQTYYTQFTLYISNARFSSLPTGLNVLCSTSRCRNWFTCRWSFLKQSSPGNAAVGLIYFRNILPQEELSFLSSFRENSNVVVFPFPFHIFVPLDNLRLIRL